MMVINEVNSLYLSKTCNSGYVFFETPEQANKWEEVLKLNKVGHTNYILKSKGHTYYGFKMFRMKYQLIELCAAFKEVVGC